MSDKSAQGGPNQGHYGAAADYFLNKANEVRDGHVPWWCYNCGFGDYHGQGQQHMAYECDASLGAPSPVDCSQLDYSQLGIPSDTVTIGPGAPKVLVSSEFRSLSYSLDERNNLEFLKLDRYLRCRDIF